jgi:hypothetical protein
MCPGSHLQCFLEAQEHAGAAVGHRGLDGHGETTGGVIVRELEALLGAQVTQEAGGVK